jgi:hypothetical protein
MEKININFKNFECILHRDIDSSIDYKLLWKLNKLIGKSIFVNPNNPFGLIGNSFVIINLEESQILNQLGSQLNSEMIISLKEKMKDGKFE